jgi:agmatine deiminase
MTTPRTPVPALIGILTVSDRASRGEYADEGGPAIRDYLAEVLASPWEPRERILPDDLDSIAAAIRDLSAAGFEVVRIPSPGRLDDEDGAPIPASHMNFLIANSAVVVPTYGNESAARLAGEALALAFPDREIILLPSIAILSGGGSFHCITQQEPA